MTATALLEGRNLRKTYRLGRRNTVEALRGVDVRIEQGEMVAIMGPSGSGKSTLMHILGLLHAPDLNHGPRPELSFDGRDMVALGESERTRIRARQMGFVFQDFNLVPTLTALENVMLACDYAGHPGPDGEGGGARGARPRRAWPTGPTTGRPSCRAASSSGWRSPGRSSTGRRSILADEPTGQPRLGALGRGPGAAAPASTASTARRSSWSPTTPRSARPATASSGCATAGCATRRRPSCR